MKTVDNVDKFPRVNLEVSTKGKRINMSSFEQHRLNRYIDDTQHRLLIIRQMLRYPLTSNQAAADTMAKAAVALVVAIRQQIMIDSNL